MSAGENQFSLTGAASMTGGATKKQIPISLIFERLATTSQSGRVLSC
jgi:hypothetical protein